MRGVLVALALLGPPSGSAQETVELRFEDIPRLVAEKNQRVSGAERLADGARARAGYLGRSYLPTLGLEAGAERFETLRFEPKTQPFGHLEARVNLYRGGRDGLQAKTIDGQVDALSADARRIRATEVASARRTYWRLVSSRETAKVIEAAVSQNARLLETANRRISRGLATETDRLEFEIHRSQLQEELESLNHAALLLEIRLAADLGLLPGTRFKTPDRIEHDHDEALLAAPFAAAAHPDARSLDARRRSLDLERKKAQRWWTPSVDAYGGYYLYTLRERDSLSQRERGDKAVGLRLSVPLFDGLRSRAEAESWRIQADGVGRQTAQRELAVDAEVRVAKEDLRHDHELIHYAEERIEQGRRYLARTLEEYERGVKNSLDALGAAQRYLGYSRAYAERRRDYQVTKAGLLALMGE